MQGKIVSEYPLFTIRCYTGILLESQRATTTQVSGGGGYYVSVESHTTTTNDFFLSDEQGNERAFSLTDWDFPMRAGHEISVYAVFPKFWKDGLYICLINRSLNKISYGFHFLNNRLRKKTYFIFKCVLAGLIFSLPLTIPNKSNPDGNILTAFVIAFLIMFVRFFYTNWLYHSVVHATKKAVQS